MKKIHFLLSLIIITFHLSAIEKIPAFPGAEGFGMYATGGRGGRVIEVTTLEDYEEKSETPIEGSLRKALKTEGDDPITIVFRVAGRIDLKERLKCNRHNMTIAGQTAPGDGICISGNNIYFSGKNFIIRHLRFRTGDEQQTNASCINIENAENFIVDHCSFSWSIEENMTVYDNKYSTVQWCIISEPLYSSVHAKGIRGYGMQWGGQYASYHHNLIAHAYSRAPRINGSRSNDIQAVNDYVNNVIYNWGKKNSVYGGESQKEGGACLTNWVNNYYKPGPASPAKSYFAEAYYTTGDYSYGQWYVSGNYIDDASYTAVNEDNHKGMNYKGGETNQRSDTRFEVEDVTTTTAARAYIDVLANAGARLSRLDATDQRIIDEASGKIEPVYIGSVAKKLSIIDSQNDVGSWAEYKAAEAPTDTDKDGIPDYWELENGLDPNNPDDGAQITVSGYSNLEIYINSIPPSPTGDYIPITENKVTQVYISDRELHIYSPYPLLEAAIYNLNGKIVFSKSPQTTYLQIPLTSIPSGIYIIKLKSADNKHEYHKIII
ncbi:T9SS C-terminal target domain-containing protein [Paludibacter sp. 221]|uniref:T9SS type A sorting domain-containing protein n=1 Tax=Paludibacter sp. 221 TaxID=2302939 RepID=UPI0013D69068|nr:T9SS type A sorting domain-containing protein [Paludibacter sp. 221]NDV46675.1 T9SS C-terminal target domain-containing protein [Paludibacter sp. 221]